MAALLEVKDLMVSYNNVEAVSGVSLSVKKNSLVSVIGANGAGKTTMLRALSGLQKAASGEIWFEGERLEHLRPNKIVQRGVAQVPEGRRVFPQLTVIENLRAGAYLLSDQREVNELLEDVFDHFPRLKERIRQRAGSLSGGEQQMLAIGRALMSKPKLLMMDEPSLGLSPMMVQEIGHIIGALKEKGRTILLVEQNASLALTLADRTYVLQSGKVVLEGASQELMNNELVKAAYLGG